MKFHNLKEKLKNNKALFSIVYWIKFLLKKPYLRSSRASWKAAPADNRPFSEIRFAVICDDLTWSNMKDYGKTFLLTPQNWYREMEENRPDIFFCEACWKGPAELGFCWKDLIYRLQSVYGDNRIVLKKILRYCKQAGIPTVFWNKEDPNSDGSFWSFTETALLFDHIFTSASEKESFYTQKGHKSVHTMMFGFSPKLFYPISEMPKKNTAVFFGSWYNRLTERCETTEKLFDFLLSEGIELTIFDRMAESKEPDYLFPEKYRSFVRPAILYSDIREAMKYYEYVININTVTESETMFARRVFEAMACGKMIISNRSKGMERLFPDSVWYYDKPFSRETITEATEKNLALVFRDHTMTRRLSDMLNDINFNYQVGETTYAEKT